MPTTTTRRRATDAERAQMQRIDDSRSKRGRLLGIAFANSLVAWAATLLLWLGLWVLIVWGGRELLAMEFALRGRHTVWIAAGGVVLCAVYAIRSSAKWYRRAEARQPKGDNDARVGEVIEHHLIVVGAMRVVEPEHGHSMLLLHLDSGKVFALGEVTRDGSEGVGPVPGFQPLDAKRRLEIARAPNGDYLVGAPKFTGDDVPLEASFELGVDPSEWPEDGEYFDVPWAQVRQRLEGKARH